MTETAASGVLKREVGVFGATMMGIGSMVGTGVFVSIGIAAGIAGPAVILAIALAAIVATCNALSSAQLAASMPVSGGTCRYGYAYLAPSLGFTAGWMFLCAKTASAATAALGFAGVSAAGARAFRPRGAGGGGGHRGRRRRSCSWAFAARIAPTSSSSRLPFSHLQRFFVDCRGARGLRQGSQPWLPFFRPSVDSGSPTPGLLEATALMFVAFTGYARIATLGEEMQDPARTIPRAIIAITGRLGSALHPP